MLTALPLPVLSSVRVATWCALFEAYGYPAGVTPADVQTLSAPDVASRVIAEAERLPRALARALATILAFSTEDGRRDIYNAAEALGYARRWPETSSPADLAAHLLAQAPRDPEVTVLLEIAQILRDRAFRPRSKLVYFGSVKQAAAPADDARPKVEAAFATWCASRDFGAVVSIAERSARGVTSWDVVHEDRICTDVIAWGPPVARRPLRSHFIRYMHSRRRLEITTDCAEAATPLARIFGLVLFGAARHFLDEPAVDLWKLQELGAASLYVPELASKLSVSGIGGTWHSGKGHAMTPRGRDFFKAMARYKIRFEGGRLDLFTLRAKVPSKGGAPQQADVALRPPHLCTVSEPELEPLLDEFLDRARITAPEPRKRDFFTMQPWNDPASGWILAEGEDGFAYLVASGLLKPNPENRSVTPPDHPHAGPTATAYPLRGTQYIAWSPDATIAPFLVEEADLVVYALQFGKLAAVIASALGLESPAAKLDEDGLLYCGRRALGPTFVLVFLATRPIRPTTAERLRDLAGYGHAVIVAPEGRTQTHGLRHVTMPKLAGPWEPVLLAITQVLKLESFVEVTALAPPDARFVLQRATQRMWFDKVACIVTERQFRLLEALIQQRGREIYTKELAEYVTPGHAHSDTTRKVLESLFAVIEKSFKAAKQKPPKDLRELIAMPRHGHYVLTVKGFVV